MPADENVQNKPDATALVASSDSEYARRRRQHMSLINQLRSIGAQADLDLPRIAVIGNQSAGKSSLVEAISGISVPRDAGTCTRCPMECRLMSSSEPWSCQVSIRWDFDANDKRKEKVQEVLFGDLIRKKKDVELALRRAQSAVLNPSKSQRKFLNMSAADLKGIENELKFSRNAVCVQLTGPELTDLAFVDLPGIIQNADADIVRLVETLVTSNIEGNCLILVTLPMSDDIENQKAAQLAKIADPSGLRTIGVMTKPDTLGPGATKARQLWLDVLEERRHPTALGYYCTRQPDDDERSKGITTAQARAAENEFFSKTSPWSTSTHKDRFGTDNLVANLSRLLSKIIDDSLPKLQKEVTTQLDRCTRELREIPPAVTSDPASYVLTLVTEFCNDIGLHVKGGEARAADLVQNNRRTYATFKRDIRGSAPPFMPYPCAEEAGTNISECLRLDDNDADDAEDDDAGSGVRMENSEFLYLDDVHKHIQLSLARELPNNVPYSSKISLIEGFQASWDMDTQKCFKGIYKAFETTLLSLVKARFSRYDHLANHITLAVRELLKDKHSATWNNLKSILDLEKRPYTQNGHYLQVTKDKYLSKYKAARAEAVAASQGQPPAKKQRRAAASTLTTEAQTSKITAIIGSGTRNDPVNLTATGVFGSTSNPFLGKPSTQSAFSNGFEAFSGFGATAKTSATPIAPPIANFTFVPPTKANSPRNDAPSAKAPSPVPGSPPSAAPAATPSAGQKRVSPDEEREQYEREALAALAMLGYHGISPSDFAKLREQDIYESEMEVMAEVRAYFQVAYKRVIDYVPMMIDNQFLFAVSDSAQGFLIERLGLGTQKASVRCAGYLAEDPAVVVRRDELSRKKIRLEAVQAELDNFDI